MDEFAHLQRNCSRFQQASERYILERERRGDTVLIVNDLLSHLGDAHKLRDTRNQFRSALGLPISDAAGNWKAWRDGLVRFAALAQALRMRVIVMGATPRNLDTVTCRQEWFNLQGARRCEGRWHRAGLGRQLNQRLFAALPRQIDPLAVLCPRGCDNDRVTALLRDTDHLSTESSPT